MSLLFLPQHDIRAREPCQTVNSLEHWRLCQHSNLFLRQTARRAHCLGQLGDVAYERFNEARAVKLPEAELLQRLNAALGFYQQALALLPPNAVNDLAVAHSMLGSVYGDARDFDRALSHYREAIRHFESAGDFYTAAQTRFNVAVDLASAGRLDDAREYAYAALRNYETYGERAAEKIERTKRLIEEIEKTSNG